MDAELLVDETLDAGLEAVLEAVLAGGDFVVERAAGEALVGKNQRVHLGVDSEVVLHRTLGEGHFGLVGALDHAVIAEGNDAFSLVDNDATHLGRWVLGPYRHGFGDLHEIFVPLPLFVCHATIIAH